ncbi:MAG: prephenate dehydrogenase [Nautiliaceae bacterium]
MTCCVVGLGLMGGSFALAMRGYFDRIVGVDNNPSHQEEALKLGLVDEVLEFEDCVRSADVIVLAIPIEAIIKALKDISKLSLKKDALIIDFGSTKESIVKNCPKNIRENLVASHPMAGTEYSGPKAAIEDLYYNKVMVVCDIEESGEVQVKRAFDIYNYLKMQIKIMNSKEHDRHAAFISHMPHIVSFSIANAVLNQEDKEHIVTLAAGGFKDMSRLAKSNPTMWKSIFKENKKNLLKAVDAFEDELKRAKELIKREKWEELEEWMREGNKLHNIM